MQKSVFGNTGIINQDADGAVLSQQFVDSFLAVGEFGNVEFDDFDAGFLLEFLRGICVAVIIGKDFKSRFA